MALHARSGDADSLAKHECFKPLNPAMEQAIDLTCKPGNGFATALQLVRLPGDRTFKKFTGLHFAALQVHCN